MSFYSSPVHHRSFVCWSLALVLLGGTATPGADWPAQLHDNQRSGVAGEALAPPLDRAWTHHAPQPPEPAWPEPARQDYWHKHRALPAPLAFDRAFQVIVAGDALYFGSSSDDQLYCLDVKSGDVRWTFFAEGPIRLAPAVAAGRVYFGADDGRVYCLEARTGRRVWQRRIGPEDRLLPGNGRMISLWPVRTGVLVDGGLLYCAAGLFPDQGVSLCALRAGDGEPVWRQQIEFSAQGQLLASAERLYLPTGRTAPSVFDRRTGKSLGQLKGQGGAYAVLAADVLASGPGRQMGELQLSDAATRESLATFEGLRMIVCDGMAYLQSADQLAALDRARYVPLARERNALAKRQAQLQQQLKQSPPEQTAERERLKKELLEANETRAAVERKMKDCQRWRVKSETPHALIIAGDVLYAGLESAVAAYAAGDGAEVWRASVGGRAHGLAVADGALFVSTDRGVIHCFRRKAASQ